jgi:hypothetical protein
MKYVCLLALLGTIACAPVPDDRNGIVDISDGGGASDLVQNPNEECDADAYRPLVGTQVAATIFPTGAKLRVFKDSDIVTQEYIPQRTNVVFDSGGQIVRVFCG